jgi:translation initiation factor IF-3
LNETVTSLDFHPTTTDSFMLSNTIRSGLVVRRASNAHQHLALYHTTQQAESSSALLLRNFFIHTSSLSSLGGQQQQQIYPRLLRPFGAGVCTCPDPHTIRRCFSSRRRQQPQHQKQQQQQQQSSPQRDSKRNTDASDSGVLSNEKLIQAIVRQNRSASADSIQVRLVIDEVAPQKATVTVVSLTEAIQISLDRNTDLIGMQLNNDPPVLRATQLSKLEYQKAQKASKNSTTKSSSGSKSFRFQANIGTHDLERKVADMVHFLEDGRDCDFSVFSKRATMRVDDQAGMQLVDKIKSLVAHVADFKKPPTLNETGNNIQVKLEPIRRK